MVSRTTMTIVLFGFTRLALSGTLTGYLPKLVHVDAWCQDFLSKSADGRKRTVCLERSRLNLMSANDCDFNCVTVEDNSDLIRLTGELT